LLLDWHAYWAGHRHHARIALLAQVIDVFHTTGGPQAALDEIRLRVGRWFDPLLVDAFGQVADTADFWWMLAAADINDAILALEPASHHERLDGKGYPRGVLADEISLETRIITTADIFDAITAERPYRGAIPIPRTLEMMAENIGTAIDERCFEALKLALVRLPN